MRKFLAVLLALFSLAAVADDYPARRGVADMRAPVYAIVQEAGKGPQADFDIVGGHYAEAAKAWQQVVGEPLDLGRYGVATAAQEEAWRQVRMVGMLVGYLDEAVRRRDRALMLRAAGMLAPAYERLAATLGTN